MKLKLLNSGISKLTAHLTEAVGYYTYKPPTGPEQLLWDFYALVYILQFVGSTKGPSGHRDDWLDETIEDVRQGLLPYLKEHMLAEVHHAIQSEAKHTRTQCQNCPVIQASPHDRHQYVQELEEIYREGRWNSEYGGKNGQRSVKHGCGYMTRKHSTKQ